MSVQHRAQVLVFCLINGFLGGDGNRKDNLSQAKVSHGNIWLPEGERGRGRQRKGYT